MTNRKRHSFEVCFERNATTGKWEAVDYVTDKTKVVELPMYLSKEDYILFHRKLTFMKRYGLDLDAVKSREELVRLASLSQSTLYLCCKLISQKNIRSTFRKSVCAQIREWAEGKSKYLTPLSPNQEKSLLTDSARRDFRSLHAAIQLTYQPIVKF